MELNDSTLSASAFSGALSGNLRPSQRATLAEVVADHAAYVKVSIRDTGESHGHRDVIEPTLQAGLQDTRRRTIFAQDVLRMVLRHMPAMALHWHPSNQLALPAGLTDIDFTAGDAELAHEIPCVAEGVVGGAESRHRVLYG